MIRLTVPSIDEDDLQSVREALESGHLVQGTSVSLFEDIVAKYVGSFSIAVSSCTAALHLSLICLNIKAGDIVLVAAYSWPATANVIELIGGQPVFVDIDSKTFNINPDLLEINLKKLFSNNKTAKRVKAILPVHTFGQLADMPDIMEIANRYDIAVIEDAACALGASLNKRLAGTWGKLGCFSFHPRKIITTGEGGVIITSDYKLAQRLRALRNHGLDPESALPDFIIPGFNYRMTEFQAALGISQMGKIDRIILSRRNLALKYHKYFRNSDIVTPAINKNSKHIFQSYVVLLPQWIADQRTELISDLGKEGIETTIGTCHIPLTRYYRNRYGYKPGDFPNTDEIFSRSLTIPLYESMTIEQQNEVVEKLLNLIRRKS
ncbi:DegT/DnrJ/EryC1/StrS family aminotransferase [bacterium]|nr:DegT/DnrJ/EryC1/StrS family aminotransferase [bacterium]